MKDTIKFKKLQIQSEHFAEGGMSAPYYSFFALFILPPLKEKEREKRRRWGNFNAIFLIVFCFQHLARCSGQDITTQLYA